MPEKKLTNKLDRFAAHFTSNQSGTTRASVPERYQRLAREMGGKTVERPEGAYCLIETRYPRNYAHGSFRLDRKAGKRLPLSAFTALEEPGCLDVRSMLFVDCETTGLGGAGAVAFLIGFGSLKPAGFEIRQYLLPDYSDEAALLEGVLEELSDDAVLVSYNGAAFDLPLIRDRMIINRVASDVTCAYHVDLLHSTRRLFRRRLQDCTLTHVEASVFGLERCDDVPGYLIPSIYFEWLQEENLDLMPRVLEHNRLDIVSLWGLVHQFAEVHESRGGVLDEVDDLHSLSRIFGRRKRKALVSEVFDRMGGHDRTDLAEDIVLYHSLNYKRMGEIEQAVKMWQGLCEGRSREGYWANLELAKYFEHCRRDFRVALKHARRAERICPYGETHRRQLANRIDRLELKLSK